MNKIYRAVREPRTMEFPRATTNRSPGNVPYIVDNIWEWLRPAAMPSRRRSAFASPAPELAAKAAGLEQKNVYVVELLEGQNCAQLFTCDDPSDARHHPDVKRIRRAIDSKILPKGWLDKPAGARGPIGALFLPCLEKAEVEACLQGVDVEPLREACSFWDDVILLDKSGELHESGEIFFEGAYALRSV
jgi:hypothetical protein